MLKHYFRAFALSIALTSVVTGSVSATPGYNSELNKPSYWGVNCVKTDMTGEVMTYTAPAGAAKVIVKGGTENAIYTTGSFAGLTAPINERSGKPYAISHVIVCSDVVVAPVKPVKPGAPVHSSTPSKPSEPGKGGTVVNTTATPTQVTHTSTGAPTPVAVSMPSELPETGTRRIATVLSLLSLGMATYMFGRIFRRA